LVLSSESLGSVFVAGVFLAAGRDKTKIEKHFAFSPPDSLAEHLKISFGAYGIRTRDLLNAIEALYQLS
jgi:hypothetical protein